jgi:hypothetical protein
MKLEQRYHNTRLLSLSEVWQLASDLKAECVEANYPHNNLVAWYLRNKCYLPFSLIAELCDYSSSDKASRAVKDVMDSSQLVSMSSEYMELIELFDCLSSEFYNLGGNTLLERSPDEFKTCMLLEAAEFVGYKDNRRNGQWFEPTPKHSSLATYMEIKRMEEMGCSCEDILSNFTFKSNK